MKRIGGCRPVWAAVLGAALAQAVAAQDLPPAVRAWGRIEPAAVSIQAIAPADAFALKTAKGGSVLLIDLRSREEAAFGGAARGVDALVPYTQIAQPLQWDAQRQDFVRQRTPGFVDLMQAWVSVLGGDHDTPLLLLCRDGQAAAAAARELALAGYANVRPVAGGFDGALEGDGRRHGGWKEALPWQAQADARLLFGDPD